MSAATVARFRRQVGWKDLAWVAWRQHRLMLIGTGIIVLAGAACMALLGVSAASRGSAEISILMFDSLRQPAEVLATCMMGYGAVVAVFWAAPLLSREYEQRTHMLAWSQDVSALRWLVGKTLVLWGVAVVFALVLGTAGTVVVHQMDGVSQHFNPFQMPFFEAAPLVQVGYASFGFALGLAISAISRRTVLSMGLSFGVFLVVRFCVATWLRPYYRTPVRATGPISTDGGVPNPVRTVPEDVLYVDRGLLDQAGNPMDYPRACRSVHSAGGESFTDCLQQNGAGGRYVDYQPIERLGSFHLIEFGIYAGLAIALFLLTWRVMRRTTRV